MSSFIELVKMVAAITASIAGMLFATLLFYGVVVGFKDNDREGDNR